VSGEGVGTLPRGLAGVEGKGPILASRASALLRAVATALHRRAINVSAVARIDAMLHELKPLTCGTGYCCTSEHDCIETSAWIARSQIEVHELCDQSSSALRYRPTCAWTYAYAFSLSANRRLGSAWNPHEIKWIGLL